MQCVTPPRFERKKTLPKSVADALTADDEKVDVEEVVGDKGLLTISLVLSLGLGSTVDDVVTL